VPRRFAGRATVDGRTTARAQAVVTSPGASIGRPSYFGGWVEPVAPGLGPNSTQPYSWFNLFLNSFSDLNL
jgi:hypothetical protein